MWQSFWFVFGRCPFRISAETSTIMTEKRPSVSRVVDIEDNHPLDVTRCSLVDMYRSFREPCCLHHQAHVHWSHQQVLLKCRYISTRVHGVATQKIVIFIVIDMRALHLMTVTELIKPSYDRCLPHPFQLIRISSTIDAYSLSYWQCR
jgi:hypothetical protein